MSLKNYCFSFFCLLLIASCSKEKSPVEVEPDTLGGGIIDTSKAITKALPPFDGTIFITPVIILPSDHGFFEKVNYAGTGSRTIFSRSSEKWENKIVYLFQASFSNERPTVEIQFDTTEFKDTESARLIAEKYCKVVGQLPRILVNDLKTVTIRRGVYAFGGGSNNLLIYTDYDEQYYDKQGILEETLIHECTHISLDAKYSNDAKWRAAQKADLTFISTYARDNPDREDVAESLLLYLAYRYRSDRISQSLYDTIKKTIPERLKFFDELGLDVTPFE